MDTFQKLLISLIKMDPNAELERLATNVAGNCDENFEPSAEEVARWQQKFGYSQFEAIRQIKAQKSDYARFRVSDNHWDLVRSREDFKGYSRDSYEHLIEYVARKKGYTFSIKQAEREPVGSRAESKYLVKLEGVLSTADKIKKIADLSKPPQEVQGVSGDKVAIFCLIDGEVKHAIEIWLGKECPTFEPTFVKRSMAKKDLAEDSIYPTLG